MECQFYLLISAADGGGRQSSNFVEVTITVSNINEFLAHFRLTRYSFDLRENSLLQMDLEVSDLDREGVCGDLDNPPLSFSFIFPPNTTATDFPFQMTDSGILQSTRTFDYEQDLSVFTFEVVVNDGGFSDSSTVTVTIIDENEHSPVLGQLEYNQAIAQDSSPGTVILNLTATDQDAGDVFGAVVDFRLLSMSVPFALRPSGELEVTAALDLSINSYRLLVVAVDGGGRESENTISH